jgi:peroxiredoxin Q/BCP
MAKKKPAAKKKKAPARQPKAAKKASKKVAKKAAKPAKKAAAPKKADAPAERTLPTATPASGVSLRTGQNAPAFELPADTGEVFSLAGLKGKKVVLYFYPKDDTPGCTQEACDFRDNFARVQAAGAVVLGISKDSIELHKKFKAKHSLPFALLADVDGKMIQDYGVWKEKSMYGRTYMGIERTTFLIDENGKIRKIYPKVKVSGHVDEVLKDLKSL